MLPCRLPLRGFVYVVLSCLLCDHCVLWILFGHCDLLCEEGDSCFAFLRAVECAVSVMVCLLFLSV